MRCTGVAILIEGTITDVRDGTPLAGLVVAVRRDGGGEETALAA
jgi:hypothetical protein